MRTPLMAGNWKMHKTVSASIALAKAVAQTAAPGVEVMIAPTFISLVPVAEVLKGTHVSLGAQNVYPASQGAYTGEVCPNQLSDIGVKYVIIGHSERRQLMCETDAFVRDKAAASMAEGLIPILCVGESLEDRETGATDKVVQAQLQGSLNGIELVNGLDIVVAYEPIWAIGTGLTATPEQAQEVHASIRNWLANRFDKELANSIRIVYGGSVKAGNVRDLMSMADIDGALVGGASLTSEAFSGIVGYKL